MDFPLSALYAALAEPCTYTPASGGASALITAVLDAHPGDVLGGEQVSTRYEVRVPADFVAGAVGRGARFVISGVIYEATRAGQPILDGRELSVPVRVV
jgi:hypothetical protein